MHNVGSRSIWRRAGQMLSVLIVATLVVFGLGNNPSRAATPVLNVSITPEKTSYNSGDTQKYTVSWSCTSVTEDCVDSVIKVRIPHAVNQAGDAIDKAVAANLAATAASGTPAVSANITPGRATTDAYVTYNMGRIPAGNSYQAVITFEMPNSYTPDQSTVSPEVSFTSADTTVTDDTKVTNHAETTLALTKKKPTAIGPKGSNVTYSLTPTITSGTLGPNRGKLAVVNTKLVDKLPSCAVYVSATSQGSTDGSEFTGAEPTYDAATHSLTWDLGTMVPNVVTLTINVTLNYPTTCADTTVTNTATVTGSPYGDPTKTAAANSSVSHDFADRVTYGGTFSKNALQQFKRGQNGMWLYWYSNTSNMPIVLEYTDYLSCALTSPTDGSTDCANPLMFARGAELNTTSPVEFTYWTNKGNTGTQTLTASKKFDASGLAADEYITKFHYKQTLNPSENGRFIVQGQINAKTPTTEAGADYVRADTNSNAWKAGTDPSWVRVQNCVTDLSMKSEDGTQSIGIPADNLCDILLLETSRPSYYNAKSTIANSQAAPGQEVTFSIIANNRTMSAPAQPIIADLLPCGMTYVENSVAGGPRGFNATVDSSRWVTDASGCSRQLVTVTWPGFKGVDATGVTLRGLVTNKMKPGTYTNQAFISPAEREYQNADPCFYSGTTDIYDINANGSVTDKVCPVTSGMSVNELAAAGVVLESLGSVPGSVYMKYNDGTSLIRQGENGTFRITPTNTGNANLSDMTVYGTLPHVGDTAVRTSASRGSEWAPIMTGPIQVQAGDGIDPSQVSIEYSTSYNPCRGEVMERGKAKADGPAGCDNNWTSNPASWSDVKSYRIYINGKTTPIEGGASIPLIVPIKAPDNANGVAYESVAIAATQASSNQAVFPSEPFKVAIASAFDVALNKSVTSDASALSPGDEVTFRVDAANTGQGLSANTKVLEKLPDGVTFVKSESFMCPTGYVSGTPDACEAGAAAGTYDVNSGVWTIGDLTAGSHASLYVTVRLNDGTDGKTITNNVEFKDLPPYDVNLNNNKASTSITVKHRLAGKVYFDKNDSSSYTAGEEGFNGVTVNLVDAAGAVVATTTTDADGNYSFAKLGAGTYTVKVVKDGDLANLTQTEDPDGTKDNASGAITLNADNPVRENVNFGYVKKHAISGNIYQDENRDKTKNGDDINLSGVTVTLVDGSGNVVATTTTDASGNYNFPGLLDGTYTVKVDTTGKLAGFEQTEDPSGAANSQSNPITFTRNDPDVADVNFGYAKNYTVTGSVYYDKDRNSSMGTGEQGFGGITVNLLDKDGNIAATTTTAADGSYSFGKLPAGKYSVEVEQSDLLKKLEQTQNSTAQFTLNNASPSKDKVDFGFATNYTLKGTVYRDGNRSEALDAGEKLYQGVTVELLNSTGNVVATTTTDAQGAYKFQNLEAGDYKLRVVKDGALADLVQTEDPDGTADNTSGVYTLKLEDPIHENINFGYVSNNTIEGSVYRDDSRNGSQNGNEPGYTGVTVQLLDKDGTVISTVTTDANGHYSFSNLPDGDYSIKVVKDGALTDTEQTEDPDGTKDNASQKITLNEANPKKSGVNFGYVPDYSIAGNIYRDSNRSESKDASENVFQGVTVNLVDASGNIVATTTTDADGNYSFSKLPAGDYTVKVVKDGAIKDMDQTEDPDGTKDNASGKISIGADNPTQTGVNFGYNPNNIIKGSVYRDDNRSSSLNSGEQGYEGQTVQLLDENGNVIATTQTGADGSYSFEHLADGTYSVKVVKDGALADTEQTEDPDGTKDNASEPITLDPTQSVKEGVNFGYVPDYSLSGTIYRDENRNESHDSTENPYAGVTVNLLDSAGNVVATTTTDANGAYSFSKLPAGDYRVKVDTTGTLKGLDQTEDPDGVADSTSGTISLNNANRTQSGVNFGYIENNSISGTIFRDEARNGVKDPSDPGFPSVKVTLLDENGNVVETTTTDSNGAYKFSHLPDGKYRVKVDTTGVLNGLEVTLDPDTLKDSQSELIELGESNPTVENVDFGYMEKEVPPAPQPPKQPNPKAVPSKLARTGAESGVLGLGVAALVAGGALLALRRRGHIS